MDNHDNSFWKQNNRAVPGRPSPKKQDFRLGGVGGGNNKGPVGSTSFQDFQESVRDAWDMGDDEFCIISGISDAKISRRVSHSAALNVIKTHRTNNSKLHENNHQKTVSTINEVHVHNNHQYVKNSDAKSQSPPQKLHLNIKQNLNNHSGTISGSSSSSSNNSSSNNHQSPAVTTLATTTTPLTINTAQTTPLVENQQQQQQQQQQPAPQKEPDSPTMLTSDARPRYRQMHAYPGRPQLLRFCSNLDRDVEYESKIEKFQTLLDAPLLNLIALKELSWSGIPKKMRAITWRLLSGYLPTSLERRNSVLERKRLDYHNLVVQYFRTDSHDEAQQDTYRQIHIDVPRMNPHVQLFQQSLVQEMFERILFIWAIRHPASGYVQGINDLVTPFFIIFLQEALASHNELLDTFKIETLSEEQRNIIEADSFWCLSKFLDCIQDNYIFAQLGIQAKVNQLKELIQRIDGTLHKQLQTHGVDYLQFSFRWMNNLLTRELPLHCTIRLWDTYLAESDGFAVFQLYVCAAFLLHWRDQLLQEKDFQGLMLLLQNLPTHNWADSHIGILVAEAYRLKFTYADAPKHLEGKS